MVNYKQGKIYKIVNDELNLTYYGSTCNELRKRLNDHKTKAKDKKCTSHKLFESGKCKIYLVEKFPCEDKMELSQRERYYIENNECVNKNIPCRTKKEYCKDNKKNIAARDKKYRQLNKDKIVERNKKYYQINKDKIVERHKEYHELNKEKIAEMHKEYYLIKKAQQKEVYDFLTQIENSN
jgi:hypothetical protein